MVGSKSSVPPSLVAILVDQVWMGSGTDGISVFEEDECELRCFEGDHPGTGVALDGLDLLFASCK